MSDPQVDDRLLVDVNGEGRADLRAGRHDFVEGVAQRAERRLARSLGARSIGHVDAMMAQNAGAAKRRVRYY